MAYKNEIDTILGIGEEFYNKNKDKIADYVEKITEEKIAPVFKNKSFVLIGLGILGVIAGLYTLDVENDEKGGE
jgi:hypothetical protein